MTAVLLIQLGIKGALILLAAWTLTTMMRRASAASRHLVWAVAIVTTLAIPLVPVVGPSWDVVIPVKSAAVVAESHLPAVATGEELPAAPGAHAFEPATSAATAAGRDEAPWDLSIGMWALGVSLWGVGAFLLLSRLAYGIWRTRTIARHAAPVIDESWLTIYDEAAAALCVAAPVQLRRTGETAVPVACGILRPMILLPEEADEWSRERRLVVLLHELAHVRRRDCLIQTLARMTCALHWVNPLAHLAVARLRSEQERACDDLVLTAGTAAPAYADHLFDIARSFRSPGAPEWATLAMARPSQLEGRLTAILDGACNRAPLAGRVRVAVGIAGVAAIVGLGALKVSAAYVVDSSRADITLTPSSVRLAASSRQTPSPAPAPAPRPPAAPAQPVAPPPAAVPATPRPPVPPVPTQRTAPQGASEDVRRRVADALATALTDENADVRRQALNALTSMRDQRAVPALLKALRDPNSDLREAALHALGQFNVPEAYDGAVGALRDENADVRQEAVMAISRSGRPQAVTVLIPMLKDPVTDVRARAAMALGNLRDPAAIDALSAALKDPDASVRQQAAHALARIADGPRKTAMAIPFSTVEEVKRLEKTIEQSFGKDFEKRMEQLGENVGTAIEKSMENLFGSK